MTRRALHRTRPLTLSTLLVLMLALSAPNARSQSASSATAQGLFDQAKALMTAGKAAQACPKFEESQRLDPGSGTLINLALCYEHTGRTASAWSTYRDAAAAARISGNSERERGARERAAALAPKVAKLVVEVPPDARVPGLHITRDGVDVGDAQWGTPLPVDEGSHALTAKAPGCQDWQAKVDVVGAGTTATINIPKLPSALPTPAVALVPTPPPAATGEPVPVAPAANGDKQGSGLGGQRIGALALGGAGVAGIVVGTVFGVEALSKKSEADKTCDGTACTTDAGVQAGKDGFSAANVSTIAMIAGGVALAGGLVLWFTAPTDRSTQVGVTPRGFVLRQAF
jgi:hypothetical protein